MSELVVADKIRKLKVNGKLSEDEQFHDVLRKGMKVLMTYVDRINAQTEYNGVYFKIDKAETAKLYEDAGTVNSTAVNTGIDLDALIDMTIPALKMVAKDNNITLTGKKQAEIVEELKTKLK